jgi:hypothetical protein
MNNEHLTWAELKEACNKIPESQLNEPVRWWGDERGGKINYTKPLKEDMVMTDEGWEPKQYQESENDYTEEMPKGYLVLYTD